MNNALKCVLDKLLNLRIINVTNIKQIGSEIESSYKDKLLSNKELLDFFNKIKDYINDPYVFSRIAECHFRDKNYSRAINTFQYVIDNFKNNNLSNIYFRLFDIYLMIKDYNSAHVILEKCLPKSESDKANLLKRTTLLSSCQNDYSLIELTKEQIPFIKITNTRIIEKNSKLVNYNLTFNSFDFKGNVVFAYYYNKDLNPEQHNPLIIAPQQIDNKPEEEESSIHPFVYKYNLKINLLLISNISLIFKSSNQEIPFITIKHSSILKVLRGHDNWLFLNNDSNNSVSQFKGEVLINDTEFSLWKDYLNKIRAINNLCLLIPPSKETVFPQFYPFKRGKVTSIDQLSILFKEYGTKHIYPLELLRNQDNSYTKTETHWSHKAAVSVAKNVLEMLMPHQKIDLPKFSFNSKKWYGDLGIKVVPAEFSYYECLDEDILNTCKSKLIFSNYLPSQGLIEKYNNCNSIIDKTIIIFGDSFSTSMLPYFVSIFHTVILVRSNASIIQEIIDNEKPDYVLLEITERFILKAPKIFDKIFDYPPCIRTDICNIKDFVNKISSIDSISIYRSYLNKYLNYLNNTIHQDTNNY